jgi:hypothetical protein
LIQHLPEVLDDAFPIRRHGHGWNQIARVRMHQVAQIVCDRMAPVLGETVDHSAGTLPLLVRRRDVLHVGIR